MKDGKLGKEAESCDLKGRKKQNHLWLLGEEILMATLIVRRFTVKQWYDILVSEMIILNSIKSLNYRTAIPVLIISVVHKNFSNDELHLCITNAFREKNEIFRNFKTVVIMAIIESLIPMSIVSPLTQELLTWLPTLTWWLTSVISLSISRLKQAIHRRHISLRTCSSCFG